MLAQQIHNLLIKKHKTLACAESCTGGLASSFLTQYPGSSRYFLLGVVTYSNASKSRILKVSSLDIKKHGAVSKNVALAMAKSVRKLAHADFGIGITGIAGPSGGTAQKPKGTVFIAIARRKHSSCLRFLFKGNRAAVRKQAALKALQLLRQVIIREK